MPRKTDEIAKKIASLFNWKLEDDGGDYRFTMGRSRVLSVNGDELIPIVDQINRYQDMDGVAVADQNSYEVLVQSSRSPGNLRYLLREGLKLEDDQQGLRYEIDAPSVPYLIHTLSKLSDKGRPVMRLGGLLSPVRLAERSLEEEPNLFDLLRNSNSLFVLRITSVKDRQSSYWGQIAEAAYFHLSYNIDVAFMPYSRIEELVRPIAISRTRRLELGELDAPRRTYVRDLVHHYQLGVSAESPMLEYLSYYHVAEHWFESIYQEDLVEQVQSTITSPRFSYKRKQDVQGLIRTVSKAVQLRNEELVINELVGLRLTLERHVDLAQLVGDLTAFDPSLIAHYKSQNVKFSNGDRVAFEDSDDSSTFSALSKRIYKTRNALVHSKDGAKSRFVPFADDAYLLSEVPLMRFIAEQIIISSSTPQVG